MDLSLSRRVAAFYRGWQALELGHGLEAGYWVLVDDLCRDASAPTPFANRSAVENEAAALIAAVTACGSADAVAVSTRAKLQQSLEHLRAENGKPVTRAAIEARGMPWVCPTDAELEALRDETQAQRQAAEAALRRRGRDPQAYFQQPLGAAEAVAQLETDGRFWLRTFEEVYGTPTAAMPFRVVAEALAASFHNLLVTRDGRLTLLLNTSAGPVFTAAHLRFLALHEIVGHVLHFTRILDNQSLQKQAPHCGCVTIHGADALHVEGVAQILSMALLRATAGAYPEVDCQTTWGNLFMAVRHRNIIKLVAGEITPAQAAEHHVLLMGGDASRIAAQTRMYAERIVDPFACIQGLAYYASLKHYESYLALTPAELAARLDHLLFGYLWQGAA